MSFGLSIDVSDEVAPRLNQIHATVRERGRINAEVGRAVVLLCKRFLQGYAGSRHGSADKLGATPTGFVGAAIDAIHFTSDSTAIIVDFNHPWFARVGHDVHIAPGEGKKFLAIPIGADAYGKRLVGQTGGNFFKGPKGGLFWGRPYPGNPRIMQPLYILLPFVDQKQDRGRLPSDDEIRQCALDALADQFEKRINAINALENQ